MALLAGGASGDLVLGNKEYILTGYGPSPGTRSARLQAGQLRVRAIVLENVGEQVALVSGDFWSASAAILKRVEQRLALVAGNKLTAARIFFAGTHTHCSFGQIYESAYYSYYTGPTPAALDPVIVDQAAACIEAVILKANSRLAPAEASYGTAQFADHVVNRSYPAYALNDNLPPTAPEVELRKAVNPVVNLVRFTAKADPSKIIGVWGAVNCHGTTLSSAHRTFHPDFLGQASKDLEGAVGGAPWVLCSGAIGDVDPQPQGMSYAQFFAARETSEPKRLALMQRLADALRASVSSVSNWTVATDAVTVEAHSDAPVIAGATALGRKLDSKARAGSSVMAGSELGRGLPCAKEGERDTGPRPSGDSQWPKNWKGPLLVTLRELLEDQSPRLPLSVVKLGNVAWLVGLPGEPTTRLARAVENEVKTVAGATPVMVCGVTGDYHGYFVTDAEYDSQQYEGASCLWGRNTEYFLREQTRALASRPATASGSLSALVVAKKARVRRKTPRSFKPKAAPGVRVVTVPSDDPTAVLELQIGLHQVSVRPIDAFEEGGRWKLSFVLDVRVLKFRYRLVTKDGEASAWRALPPGKPFMAL